MSSEQARGEHDGTVWSSFGAQQTGGCSLPQAPKFLASVVLHLSCCTLFSQTREDNRAKSSMSVSSCRIVTEINEAVILTGSEVLSRYNGMLKCSQERGSSRYCDGGTIR